MDTANLTRDRCIDSRDMVIEALADAEAALRDTNRTLTDLLADVVFDNAVLQQLWGRAHAENIHGTATIRRLRRQRDA